MSLPEALERAASRMPEHGDALRDANGDPDRLLATLPTAAAARLLGWLLEHTPDEGSELALSWSESDAGVAAIRALDADGLAKPARKALRRVQHRLRSRGHDVAPAPSEPVVARLPDVDDGFDCALISPLNARGARMVYLVEAHPAGGARLYEGLVDALRGVLEFSVYNSGRSRVREFLREVRTRAHAPPIEVAPEQVRALLARAAARQQATSPLPRAFIEHRSQLVLDAGAETPGDRVAQALAPVEATRERIEAVCARIASGELGPWPPPPERLRPLGEDLRKKLADGTDASAQERAEQVRAALGEVAEELHDEARAEVVAECLRECAFVSWRQGEQDEARALLAAATRAGSRGGNPVAVALVEAMFAPLLAEVGSGSGGAEAQTTQAPTAQS